MAFCVLKYVSSGTIACSDSSHFQNSTRTKSPLPPTLSPIIIRKEITISPTLSVADCVTTKIGKPENCEARSIQPRSMGLSLAI